MDRPGLQRVLDMVERGHVSHVLVWRLDRLSRNLGDLQTLATGFLDRGVQLHSVTENLVLSSATGRMFYNILGSFAQFYREQLSENVRMGMGQAVREGRWINRPKTGYDLRDDGVLIANDDAPRVRAIFRLRAEGLSYRDIEQRTGTNYGTVMAILKSRIYLGEVLLCGDWFPGLHEPLVSLEEFASAHKAHTPGVRRRSRQVMAGRVRCGLCGRVAAVEYTQAGLPTFRCRHRGQGCTMPRRAATGLEKAALLGLTLLGRDESLRTAIRRQLAEARVPLAQRSRRLDRSDAGSVSGVERRRRKLLDLYYSDRIDPDQFAQEDRRLRAELELLAVEAAQFEADERRMDDVAKRFEDVAAVLAQMDVNRLWEAATAAERRVLVEEMLN